MKLNNNNKNNRRNKKKKIKKLFVKIKTILKSSSK